MGAIERIVFFGTPEFAVPSLDALVASGRRPLLVVAQPARPVGRGGRLTDPPVARRAHELGLEVAQPQKVREEEFLGRLEALAPDLGVVVAFGQIFPRRLLALPRLGCVNVHASLLPRHRGASPIQAALLAGDHETGVATMQMEFELDAGPILLERRTPIGPEETAGELASRLAGLGAELLVETIERLERGDLEARPQPAVGVTFCGKLDKELGRVDWNQPAERLFDRLRALSPWPGLTTELGGRPLKILWGRPASPASEVAEVGEPGTVLGLVDGKLRVRCGGGTAFDLERVQRPGKNPISARDFANGEKVGAGARLG